MGGNDTFSPARPLARRNRPTGTHPTRRRNDVFGAFNVGAWICRGRREWPSRVHRVHFPINRAVSAVDFAFGKKNVRLVFGRFRWRKNTRFTPFVRPKKAFKTRSDVCANDRRVAAWRRRYAAPVVRLTFRKNGGIRRKLRTFVYFSGKTNLETKRAPRPSLETGLPFPAYATVRKRMDVLSTRRVVRARRKTHFAVDGKFKWLLPSERRLNRIRALLFRHYGYP